MDTGKIQVKYETKEESRLAYLEYVKEHIHNVQLAYEKFRDIIFDDLISKRTDGLFHDRENILFFDTIMYSIIVEHDNSKLREPEFDAYAANFYTSKEDLRPGSNDEIFIKENFEKACDHHKKVNKHHPEYYQISVCDNNILMHMPDCYFAEMICDWIAVSMTNKSSVYDWWRNRGFDSKRNLFSENDMYRINEFITKHKEELDFSEKS